MFAIMKEYNTKTWTSVLFWFDRRDTFRRLFPFILFFAIYSAVIAYLENEYGHFESISTGTMHTLLGFVISLLLVFRTNTAYERWWEGRKIWGALIDAARNLAMKLNAMLPEHEIEKRTEIANLISSYAIALKLHLREHLNDSHLPDYVHKPNFIATELYKALNNLHQQKVISGEQLLVLNKDFTTFTDMCGAGERIKKTPIPFSYSVFLKKFILLYTITMPFAFAKEFGYAVILAVSLMFYVLASLEILAEEIEDPFGTDDNDLPTDNLAQTIHSSATKILLP